MANSPEEVVCHVELLPEITMEGVPPMTTEMLPTEGSSVSTTGSSPVATVEASSTTSTVSLPKLLSDKTTKC